MKKVMAVREDSMGRHRLSLVNILIYLDKFMRAGYQQAAEMLYLSNIQTEERNKARTESIRSSIISKHGGLALSSKPDREAISAFLLIKMAMSY